MTSQIMPPEPEHPAALPPPGALFRDASLTAPKTMICLAACMALQMTSYVMILPLFARRFAELGAGVGALGASEMAYALAATVCAPFMGALADRIGRRPIVLGSLAAYALTFTGYLLASSAAAIIVLRGVAGALTAGMMPAATGLVADLAPENRRGQWIGILSGGASAGWIAGPILGGTLYDRWGYAAALLVSIGTASLAFLTALAVIRETQRVRRVDAAPRAGFRRADLKDPVQAFRPAVSIPAACIAVIFLTYFGVMFAWACMEPRFMFHAYDNLGWTSSMLGLVISAYGAACMLGEFGLSRLSDDLGRKPVILAGLVLFSAQFVGLVFSRNYMVIAAAFAIAGIGNALFDPALSASILDVAPAEHQSRVLGLKSTVGSMGSILGPMLVALSAWLLDARSIFLLGAGIVLLVALMVALDGKGLRRGREANRPAGEVETELSSPMNRLCS